jgi:hypothetical protein
MVERMDVNYDFDISRLQENHCKMRDYINHFDFANTTTVLLINYLVIFKIKLGIEGQSRFYLVS